jgi:hypothetical protein
MRTRIDYKLIPKDSLEFGNLQDFAESFDHKITDHPNINVYGHYRDGQLFGYSDHVFIPVVYPAFHPQYTKPQDVIQVMTDWRAHAQLSGGVGYIGVPLINDRPNFSNQVMTKLGLTKMDREIYSYNSLT